MKVPLAIRDHVERAGVVYGDRIGIVDEPDQPAARRAGIGPGEREKKVK